MRSINACPATAHASTCNQFRTLRHLTNPVDFLHEAISTKEERNQQKPAHIKSNVPGNTPPPCHRNVAANRTRKRERERESRPTGTGTRRRLQRRISPLAEAPPKEHPLARALTLRRTVVILRRSWRRHREGACERTRTAQQVVVDGLRVPRQEARGHHCSCRVLLLLSWRSIAHQGHSSTEVP